MAELWKELADRLIVDIENRAFAEVDGRMKLPSEAELMGMTGYGRNTVRHALSYLEGLGRIERKAAQGAFVILRLEMLDITMSGEAGRGGGEGQALFHDANLAGMREKEAKEITVGIIEADEKVAWHLRVPVRSIVVSRSQNQFVEKGPWLRQTSFYPEELIDRGATRLRTPRDIVEGTVAYLHETLGIVQAGYHDEIQVRDPTADEIEFFGFPSPERRVVPVIETRRAAYDEQGVPFRLTITVWAADRNRLHYQVGRVPADILPHPTSGPDQP